MEKKDAYNVTDLAKPFDIRCDIRSLMLPMRDGVKLHTMIYLPPDRPERTGVLLIRSPYYRTNYFEIPDAEAMKNGQALVTQACRGTGWSEGEWDPADRDLEMKDTEDTFAWLERQEFYNGRCVMAGGSYSGWTQWAGVRTGYKGVLGATPNVAPLTGCTGAAVRGGGVQLSFAVQWMLSMYHRRRYGYAGVPDYDAMKTDWHTPVIECDRSASYPDVPAFRRFMRCADEPHKQLSDYQSYFRKIAAPVLISGGWFDNFLADTIESFQRMQSEAATPEARNFTRLIVGPWGHGGLLNPELFGKETDRSEVFRLQYKFLLGRLKDPQKDPLEGEPAVHYYMLGENRWHNSPCWPPAGTRETVFCLHSGGNANSSSGDGAISSVKPGQETPDTFISDPAHPVLSNHGRHESLGCYDRSEDEKRSDVLVYTMPVQDSPMTVAGQVKLRFHAAVSAPDTDFVVKLIDLTPEGKALYVAQGMVRARFRNGTEKAELLEPGKITEFEILLNHTAVSFLPGHRLRIEICGQDFPFLGRNPNTGKTYTTDPELRCAVISLYHDAERPAQLFLPVME